MFLCAVFFVLMPLNRYTYNGVTCRATRRRSSTRDDKKYMREVEHQGKTRLVHYGDPNLEMQRDNPERRENFLARHNCSEKKDPFAPGFWACYDWKNTNEKSMEPIKIISQTDTTAVIGGYGVIFGGRDLTGETFTPDTEFGLNRAKHAPFHIDHTLDTEVMVEGKTYKLKAIHDPVGEIIEVSPDDYGLYMHLQVEKGSQYWPIVEGMVASGKAGLSTGANHTARKSADGIITYWPINEISLTMTPAEPRTVEHLQRIKSAEETPEAESAAVQSDIDETKQTAQIEVLDMTDNNTAVDAQRVDSLEQTTKAINDKLEKLFERLETPQAQSRMKQAGYIAPDSTGNEDSEVKSMFDMLTAIKAGNVERLKSVYKTQTSLDGTVGGYLVPEATLAEIMPNLNLNTDLTSRCRRIPVPTPSGYVPIPDYYQSLTAGAGQTAESSGVTSTVRSENSAYTKTTMKVSQLEYRVYDALSGYVQVTRELSEYVPTIASMLQMAIEADVTAKKEFYVLRGDGTGGNPLGMFNWTGKVAVSPDTNGTFAYADMLEMQSRLLNRFGGSPVFVAHQSLIPDIGVFEIGSNGAGVPSLVGQPNGLTFMPGTNIPILYSQHMPQARTAGSIMLVDPSLYGIFEYRGLYIEFSRDYDFLNGRDTWRFGQQIDGKPLMKDDITLAGPGSAYTVSPVVSFTDAAA